jgi:tetratricopeptide (TPR) repeat protein
MKGVSSLEANDVAGAKAHFQAALQANPADADALYYLGQFSEQAGDVGGAETLYKRAVQARPGFALAEENLSALYDDAQRYDDALAVITPGLAAHPKDGTLHLNAGIAYGGKKDEASAVREFDVAIGIAPSDASFRFVYGHWLGAFGRQDAALAQLQAAVARAGKNVGVLAGVAHELHVLKALPECVAVFTQAIALKDAAELWTERAACKIGQKDDAGALADLRAATTKDAAYAPAHLYLGNELAKAGDYTAAIAEYQAFLKLEPNGPYAKTVAEKIRVARQHGGH